MLYSLIRPTIWPTGTPGWVCSHLGTPAFLIDELLMPGLIYILSTSLLDNWHNVWILELVAEHSGPPSALPELGLPSAIQSEFLPCSVLPDVSGLRDTFPIPDSGVGLSPSRSLTFGLMFSGTQVPTLSQKSLTRTSFPETHSQ